MIITGLELQKKNKNRYNLYLDNDFYMGIHEDVIVNLRLQVKQEIDKEFLKDVIYEEELAKYKQKALKFATYRLRSQKEIEDYLTKDDLDPTIVDSVLSFLNRYNFIDDEAFCKAFIHDKASISRHSLKKIKYDLKSKGIFDTLFDQAVQSFEEDFERDNIEYFIQKKYKTLSDQLNAYEKKQKILAFLTNKGFDYYLVKESYQNLVDHKE